MIKQDLLRIEILVLSSCIHMRYCGVSVWVPVSLSKLLTCKESDLKILTEAFATRALGKSALSATLN